MTTTKRNPKPRRSRKKTILPIRVIKQTAERAIVAYLDAEGIQHRVTIPPAAIEQGQVSQAVLEAGIPYGVAWERYINLQVTPERVAAELRRRGIWTWHDYQIKPHLVVAAFQQALQLDIDSLRAAAARNEQGGST